MEENICVCKCSQSLERAHKEIEYWRRYFLKMNIIAGRRIEAYFMSIPSMSMVQKSPEENLIDCLRALVQLMEEKR